MPDISPQFYSISDLVEKGYSRTALETWVHADGFPCFRTSKRGKFLIDIEKMEKWLIKKGYKKRTSL